MVWSYGHTPDKVGIERRMGTYKLKMIYII